jgi:TetR/AcrR family transcriptional regulator, mexJK operon transcriptional repressor
VLALCQTINLHVNLFAGGQSLKERIETLPIRRGRGRPTRSDARSIDRALLNAARQSFLERGYSQTTLEEIARAAGITKPTLYARYADKSALFAALMRDRLEEWAGASPLETDDGGTLEEWLVRFATYSLDLLAETETGLFADFVINEGARFPEVKEVFRTVMFAHSVALVTRRIAIEPDAQDDRPDPEWVAARLFELIAGWLHYRRMLSDIPDPQARRDGARQCVAVLLHGIAAAPRIKG